MHFSQEQTSRLLEALRHDFGQAIAAYLLDEKCEDIVLNADGYLWAKRLGSRFEQIGSLTPFEAETIITTIARLKGLEVNYDHPVLETTLPMDGSRIEALLPPIVESPVFAIRSRAKQIYTLDQYVESGILSEHYAEMLKTAIVDRQTILISGSTGSGKSTLLNGALDYMVQAAPNDRLALIEDTPELQCSVVNHVALLSSIKVTMDDCLRACMRLRPDRIIVGEVRGKETHTMLKAFNTGHPGGLATVHSNDALASLVRLESLVAEAIPGIESQRLIAEAIDLVVHINGPRGVSVGRKVNQLMWVRGYDKPAGHYQVEYV